MNRKIKNLMQKRDLDTWFIFPMVTILVLGLIMVTSASLALAEGKGLPILFFAKQQTCYYILGFFCCWLVSLFPMQFWKNMSPVLILASVFSLMLLFVPGLGREVNGSIRWLNLGVGSVQVSEFVKLSLILYMAGFLVRHQRTVKTELMGFLKPLAVLCFIVLLLLLEPDFGTAVVMVGTVLGMLFIGGVPLHRFLILIAIAGGGFALLSFTSPYRMARLTAFLNPWADQFNSGYQLTQSLIAFGRGGLWGTGLGNSIQKLLYLPEPHTDFLFAVIAEELGLIGGLAVLMLFCILIYRIFALGKRALHHYEYFSGYVALGIGFWLALQTIINVGVNIGVLPTKGLTLPLMSYGGNSLVVCLMAIGILLRIDYELKAVHFKV